MSCVQHDSRIRELETKVNAAVEFIATVDGVFVRYGKSTSPEEIRVAQREMAEAIGVLRAALKAKPA